MIKIYNRCNKNKIKKSNSKKAETTGDLIGNKTADKITSISKKKSPNNDEREEDVEITTHKKGNISPEEG